MLKSNAIILSTIFFAIFGIFSMFYGLFMTQLKLGDTSHFNLLSKDDSPWFKPKTKVVFMVIDGLRFDYLLDFDNLDHDERLKVNKFNKLNQAFSQDPEKFVVFRTFSDFPTMTVMRVPCLMTGNIPSRANIVTAFGPISSKEDSVLRQLKLQDKKSYLAGDLTLFYYFGEYLNVTTEMSVDLFDNRNDKVDVGTHKAIKELIAQNDFDLLATHLLRIDHMGHAYSLYNDHVPTAIDDVDQLIMEIIDTIDDDTMLIFVGDHGMSSDGNHGSASTQETNTAMMAYHKKGFMKYKHKGFDKIMRSVNETKNQIRQADLAPTLSMLMGAPIPYSSMGQILSDLYPVGDYYPSAGTENCPDAAFEMQMLHDNHLNTLQIMNYIEKYQHEQHLFTKKVYNQITSLAKEIEVSYKKAQEMIDKSQQCEPLFQEVTINAISKSQEFSNLIYELVDTTVPYEMTIFAQGFALLLIVAVFYVLSIQLLYKTKDYEHISFKEMPTLKASAPLIVTLALVWFIMLACKAKIMHPVTTSVLILAIWIFKSSFMTLFISSNEKIKDSSTISTTPPTSSEDDKLSSQNFSLGSLFILQSPRISAAAIGIFGLLFYLIHAVNVDFREIKKVHWLNPYVILSLIAVRLCGKYPRISSYILIPAAALGAALYLFKIHTVWSGKLNLLMGLLLIADWVWSEIHFSQHKLKNHAAWSYQYVICFSVLAIYHLSPNREVEMVQIFLPRIIWALIAVSFIVSLALKMKKSVIKRNLQAYSVLFMVLVQSPEMVLYLGMVLSAMRITTYFFKRTTFRNYLYPLIISFIGYIGLFMIKYTDRKLPNSFAAAFVGLRGFNIVFSLILFLISMLSTILLGILFISFYDQDLKVEEVDLGVEKEDQSMETLALKGHSKIIKKRNVILYSFLYNAIMLSAAMKTIIYIDNLRAEGVMQKFMVDGGLYSAVITTLYLMV